MADLIFYVILGAILLPIILVLIIGIEQGWKGSIKWEDDEINSYRWTDGK